MNDPLHERAQTARTKDNLTSSTAIPRASDKGNRNVRKTFERP